MPAGADPAEARAFAPPLSRPSRHAAVEHRPSMLDVARRLLLRQLAGVRSVAPTHLRTLCFVPQNSRPTEAVRRNSPAEVAQHPRAAEAVRQPLPSSRSPPAVPEADSVSESEFRKLPAGGASAFNFGEFGASPEEMERFWFFRGVADDELLKTLSQRAASDGGVWGDPPTLAARLEALQAMLPMRAHQRHL